jgi:hypothetical protein
MKLLTTTLLAFTALSVSAWAESPAERQMHSFDTVLTEHEAAEMPVSHEKMPCMEGEKKHHHHGHEHHGHEHHHHHHGKKGMPKKAEPKKAPAAQ